MATYAIRTEDGVVVGFVRAADDAPRPGVSGEPGYSVSAVDIAEETITTTGEDAEEQVHDVFQRIRAAAGPSAQG